MGTVENFLGIRFDWDINNKENLSCKLVQQAYVETMIHKMDLSDCRIDPTMTPYRSGLPIDSLPPPSPDVSPELQEKLIIIKKSYFTYLIK